MPGQHTKTTVHVRAGGGIIRRECGTADPFRPLAPHPRTTLPPLCAAGSTTAVLFKLLNDIMLFPVATCAGQTMCCVDPTPAPPLLFMCLLLFLAWHC